ncbi:MULTISPECIES: hypothetical protein [Streptomyces griseus group]|uniref:hypothetical protein n=1 Tax=Streptomyces griseus group TaxID=629295 RepID=UPI0036679340
MSTPTVTLNDLIATQLSEIAEDAWKDHSVLRITGDNGRMIQPGEVAVMERWRCEGDHGFGLCGQPLLTTEQAALVIVGRSWDFTLGKPAHEFVWVRELTAEGLEETALFHLTDVTREFEAVRKAQG